MKKILLAVFASCILATQAFAAYLPFIDDGGDTYVNNVYTTTVNGVQIDDDVNVYVNGTTGSDVTGDGTLELPYATINKGMEELVKWVSPNTMHLYISSGTYVENINVPREIAGVVDIQGNSANPDSVIIQAANPSLPALTISGTAKFYLRGVKIQGATNTYGVFVDRGDLSIMYCKFYNNQYGVSAYNNSKVNWYYTSTGASTIDGNNIATSYGIISDFNSVMNIAQGITITNVSYGVLTRTSTTYLSAATNITASLGVWTTEKNGYNNISGTQTFACTSNAGGRFIFKVAQSEIDFLGATINMSTSYYGFYGLTGVKITDSGSTFSYDTITKEAYLDYDTVLDTTDSLSTTPEYYMAADEYGYDARFTPIAHATNNGSDHSYIDQDVKTTASPTFSWLNLKSSFDGYPKEGVPALVFSGVSSGGNIEDGNKYYFIQYIAIDGTAISYRVTATGITDGNNTVNLTFPAATDRVLSRKLYRSSNLSDYYLVDTITDNSLTTYSDTKSNDSLGVDAHTWLSSYDGTKNVLYGSGGLLLDSGSMTTTKFLYGIEIFERPSDSSISSSDSILKITGSADGTLNYEGSGIQKKEGSYDIEDDGVRLLINDYSGWGKVYIGDNEESADFSFTSAGVITLERNTANVVNTDTDGKFCIYFNPPNVAFKNRLGSTKTVKYVINY